MVFVLGFAMAGASAMGQATIGGLSPTDPFSLYYGFYLPRQAALAVTPRAETPINQMAAIRQQNALTERAGLYDPVQPFGSDYDPANPFARGKPRPGGKAVHTAGGNGAGPPMYFNRTATYYPATRTGRSMNASVAAGGNAARPNATPAIRPPSGIGMPSMLPPGMPALGGYR
jgi:hypothetical protein